MNIQNLLRKEGIKSIWHFTDLSNMESIEEYGILSLSEIWENDIDVSCFGADELSHNLDYRIGLDKFVHLSFIKDHPMYHVAKRDGRILTPVWVEIDVDILDESSTLFSNKVANANGAPIFYADKVKKMINFDKMYARDFDTRRIRLITEYP